MSFKKVNILITGGCGFIGGHLVDKLVQDGANITVLDIVLSPKSIFSKNNLRKKVNLKFVDIRNRRKVFNIFKITNPSYIFHLAAEAIVENAYLNPYETFDTNIMGTVNILDATRLLPKLKGIIVASSDKAYGKSNITYKENFPLYGDHPYDVSKSCEDLISQTYFKTYGLPLSIARFGNVYGEGDLNFGRIIPDICKSIIQKKTLLLRSNGKFVRDYIYVNDVVDGYIFLLKNLKRVKGEAYNFSSKDNLSVIELINIVEKTLKLSINYKILDGTKNEIPFQHLNYSKIRKIGWKPQNTIKKVFPNILDWYKQIIES